MSKRAFIVAVQIFGIVVFAVAVTALILFAEGYLYDSKSNDIVKKGVVYIADFDSSGTTVLVDGQPYSMAIAGEIRVSPGIHTIEIKKPSYVSWVKKVNVPEEDVLRFPTIILFPEDSGNSTPNKLDKTQSWSAMPSLEDGFFVIRKSLHIAKFYPYNLYKNPVSFELPFDFDQLILLDSEGYLLGLSKKGEWKIYAVNGEKLNVKTENAEMPKLIKSFSISDDVLSVVDKDSSLWTLKKGSIEFKKNLSVDTPSLKNKTEQFADHVFDKPILWFSRIGTSYQFLVLTSDLKLNSCDEDGENCRTIASADNPKIYTSSDKKSIVFSTSGDWVLMDFHREGMISKMLHDFAR